MHHPQSSKYILQTGEINPSGVMHFKRYGFFSGMGIRGITQVRFCGIQLSFLVDIFFVFSLVDMKCRNFTAPSALRVEAGLAQVMEQYDRNLKVQKIIGSPMAHQMKRHPNGRKNRRRRGGEDDDDDGGGKVGNNFFKSLAYGRVGSDDEQEVVGGRGMGGSLRPAEPTQNKKKTSLIKPLKV